MKIIKNKRSIFIEAENNDEFERKLNESLKGLMNAEVQIYGLYQAAILYEEVSVEEEVKTIAEMFESIGNGAMCSECPHFRESEDKRRRWHNCGLDNKKVRKDTKACDIYYLERGEENEIPKVKRGDEKKKVEGSRSCKRIEDLIVLDVRQDFRENTVQTFGA